MSVYVNNGYYGPKSIKTGYAIKILGFSYSDLQFFQEFPFSTKFIRDNVYYPAMCSIERYHVDRFRENIGRQHNVALLYIKKPEEDFNKVALEIFKHHVYYKLNIYYIGFDEEQDEELKKIVLFSILKPIDLIIIKYDYGRDKLIKYKDEKITNSELI